MCTEVWSISLKGEICANSPWNEIALKLRLQMEFTKPAKGDKEPNEILTDWISKSNSKMIHGRSRHTDGRRRRRGDRGAGCVGRWGRVAATNMRHPQLDASAMASSSSWRQTCTSRSAARASSQQIPWVHVASSAPTTTQRGSRGCSIIDLGSCWACGRVRLPGDGSVRRLVLE